MVIAAILLALFMGCSFAALYTVHNITKSNELGNSKSTLAQIGGNIIILEKENSINPNRPI